MASTPSTQAPPNLPVALVARTTLVATGVAALLVGLVLVLVRGLDVLLVMFAGVLVAVAVRAPAEFIHRHTRIPPRVALALVLLAIAGVVVGFTWFLAPKVYAQGETLTLVLAHSVERIVGWAERQTWLQEVFTRVNVRALISQAFQLVGTVRNALFAALWGISAMLLVAVVGLFVAADPMLYLRGIVRLVPKPRRRRAVEVLSAVGHTLRNWLLGRLVAMLAVGGLTAVGLWFLDVPLALVLGLSAGLLSFIPNIGFFMAGILIVLFGLAQGTNVAVHVLILYLVVQWVEGNFITPLVEHRAVNVPPALNLIAQLMLAYVAGTLGLLLAAPLVAVLFVLVRMLYVEGVLGDHSVAPSTPTPSAPPTPAMPLPA